MALKEKFYISSTTTPQWALIRKYHMGWLSAIPDREEISGTIYITVSLWRSEDLQSSRQEEGKATAGIAYQKIFWCQRIIDEDAPKLHKSISLKSPLS